MAEEKTMKPPPWVAAYFGRSNVHTTHSSDPSGMAWHTWRGPDDVNLGQFNSGVFCCDFSGGATLRRAILEHVRYSHKMMLDELDATEDPIEEAEIVKRRATRLARLSELLTAATAAEEMEKCSQSK